MTGLNLRIRFPDGQGVLKGIDGSTTLESLIFKSLDTMNVRKEEKECSQILSGFPPKPLEMADTSVSIESLGIKSGDTLIFKLSDKTSSSIGSSLPNGTNPSTPAQNGIETAPPSNETNGIINNDTNRVLENSEESLNKRLKTNTSDIVLKRVVVPADNSCLFTSINCCMCGEVVQSEHIQFMREIISVTVSSDQEKYSEAFLGKSNEKYCSWIQTKDAWGGAIEVQILAEYFQVMIVVVDTQSVSLTKFGEFGNFDQMMLIIYDGIHYDALCQQRPTRKTIFSSKDERVLDTARILGETERKAHNYTDTTGFTLKCLVCGHKMKGQKEAQSHAMSTKHTNFSEV